MLVGAILIGGRSRRMGRPKQLLMYQGSSFLERVLDVLQPHVNQVVFVGSGPLPSSVPNPSILSDTPGLLGPLAGIHKARQSISPEATLLVCACDMPLIDHDAVRWLIAQREYGLSAVIPKFNNGRLEPLFALYEPSALPLLDALSQTDNPALYRLGNDPAVRTPSPPETLEISWTNINCPADFARLQNHP
jgi:molybdopterin-guanine dinucleotide biosynthesis protein A